MKVIVFDDSPGGTKKIEIYSPSEISISSEAENEGCIGFQVTKRFHYTLNASLEKADVILMNRKRNVMKHIQKLFGGKRRGKNTDN